MAEERPGSATPAGGVIGYMVRHRTAANLLLALMLVGGLAAGLKIRTQCWRR